MFDLSSNRLKVETSVVESIVTQSKVSEKQQDGLVKINTTIQSLSERAKLKWKKMTAQPILKLIFETETH